jgi:hypothetical protein
MISRSDNVIDSHFLAIRFLTVKSDLKALLELGTILLEHDVMTVRCLVIDRVAVLEVLDSARCCHTMK